MIKFGDIISQSTVVIFRCFVFLFDMILSSLLSFDLVCLHFLVLQMGSSNDPCSQIYHGASTASESEVKAIVDYLKQRRPFVGAIDFHSFSQTVIYPYGQERFHG